MIAGTVILAVSCHVEIYLPMHHPVQPDWACELFQQRERSAVDERWRRRGRKDGAAGHAKGQKPGHPYSGGERSAATRGEILERKTKKTKILGTEWRD
ncbi:MAG: hypothetical protein GY748_02630 [Planctomycetaceae bacterium]|nr:hypothetical protein [Planctomycetaceae bacterium]